MLTQIGTGGGSCLESKEMLTQNGRGGGSRFSAVQESYFHYLFGVQEDGYYGACPTAP